MMNAIPKPHAISGAICPLMRQDVSQVCHTCVFYDRVRVARGDGEAFDHWDCTFKQLLLVTRDLGTIAQGTQKALETFNHQVYTETQANLSSLITIAERQEAPRKVKQINGRERSR